MKWFIGALSVMVFVPVANGALVSRLGGQAFYDTELDITWMTEANYAVNNDIGFSESTPSGQLEYFEAANMIDAMNTNSYLGFDTWRLPTIIDPDPTCTDDIAGTSPSSDPEGWNCTGSELGHLFYSELGGVAAPDGDGSAMVDPAKNVFDNLQNSYWSTSSSGPFSAWRLSFVSGSQKQLATSGPDVFAIAVLDGDIAAVPVPAAVWLFGSALGILAWMRRKPN